jgi:hypothetical protein
MSLPLSLPPEPVEEPTPDLPPQVDLASFSQGDQRTMALLLLISLALRGLHAGQEVAGITSPRSPSPLFLGLLVETAQTVGRATRLGWNVGQVGWRITRPLRRNWLTRPLTAAWDRQTERLRELGRTVQEPLGRAGDARIQALTDRIAGSILTLAARQPALRELVQAEVAAILPELATHPQVTGLVDAQVSQILPKLTSHPEIREMVYALVQEQADRYMDYLEQDPDQIQRLVQGQSVGIVNDLLENVREQTVTADTVLERMVRRIFGQDPQSPSLPPLS